MDRHMAESLDRHITGNYGGDQFKNTNEELDWKIGDRWNPAGPEKYLLCMTKHPYRDLCCVQFVNIKTGNRFSDEVVVPDMSDWDGETISISEVCQLIFGRDISIGTSKMDNLNFDELENNHEYGPAW